jgi:alpha-galactosidase
MKKGLFFILIIFLEISITAQPKFSFKYNGIPSTDFLAGWNYTTGTKTDEYGTWNVDIYSDPVTLLEVRCEKLYHSEFNATEWVVYFENKGIQNSPILSEIRAADFVLESKTSGSFKVHYNRGSKITDTDFEPIEYTVTSPLTLAPFEGRSSAWTSLPFFNIQKPDGAGLIIGIGWTGQWEATFREVSKIQLQLIAGMQLTHLKLLPGEKIRTPSILSMPYTGDLIASQNQFRRLILNHYTPKQNGKKIIEYPHCISPYCNPINMSVITKSDLVNFVDGLVNNNYPKDNYIWLDAGWYDCSANWQNTGTWDADSSRFPGGLIDISNYIHSKGFKLMVWFEPERVAPETWLYKNKPEWLLPIPSGYTVIKNERILNLGDPDVLDWVKNKFSKFIHDNKIDIYRQDFNTNPLSAWKGVDALDRQGITEIKYVMGFYEFWDALRNDNPDLIIDNCASGGMRYDLETIKRSFSFWRDDDCWKSNVEQCFTYGLATWFPVGGRGTITTDPYDWQSGMGAIFTSCFLNIPTKNIYFSEHIPKYLQLRNLFTGDFYPFTEYSQADNVWMAWQFNTVETNEGIVQAFRRQESTTGSMTFKLKGLVPGYNYSLYNIDTKKTSIRSGNDLMNTGLTISLDIRTSALIKYSRIEQIQEQMPCYVPFNGLVGYWSFSGNTYDLSDNGNNGKVIGATPATDRHGNENRAYNFDGTSNYLDFPILSLPVGNDPRTVSSWFKTSDANAIMTIDSYGSEGIGNLFFPQQVLEPGKVIVKTGTSSGMISSINSVNDGEWHHVVTTYNGNKVNLFLDGILQDSINNIILNTSFSNLQIGRSVWSKSEYFSGSIDEIGIWNRELTPKEITNLYNMDCLENQNSGELILYPNPVKNELILNNLSINSTLEIYDLSGRKIMSSTCLNSYELINVSKFPTGMYIIKNSDKTTVREAKFVKD